MLSQVVAPKTDVEQKDTPKLTETDILQLENKLLLLENMQLRMKQTPEGREAQRLEEELQTFAKTLEREGFVLQRTGQGAWSYITAPDKGNQ